ncbi:MAG: tetratricopeptide repeat protein [Elusimicrobiales bacterium]
MKHSAQHFEKSGRQLWFKGEYYRALKLMQEGLELYPGDFRLKLGVALAQLRLGNYAIARDLLRELLDDSPNNGDALSAMCEACLSLGKKQDALDCAEKIHKHHSNSAVLLEHLGMAMLEHGLFEEAKRAFAAALAATPERPYARFGLGIVHSGQGHHTAAIREIRAALRMKPEFYEARSYLGNLLYDHGQKKRAIKIFLSIPVEDMIDPVTISRLAAYARTDKKLLPLAGELEKRLDNLTRGQTISGFLHSLEERALHAAAPRAPANMKLRLIKVSPAAPFSEAQRAALYDMDKRLKALFPRQPAPPEIPPRRPPRVCDGIEGFLSAFALYLKSVSDNSVRFAGIPLAGQSAALGIDSLSRYAAALVSGMRGGQAQSAVSQQTMDALLSGAVNIVKQMPPGLRGSEWIAELGGIILAFWTPVDMLERIFLMMGILSQPEKKSLEPVIARGRAWRRWLRFRPDNKWASPAAQLIPSLPQNYGSRQQVRCARCQAVIADYPDISQPEDTPPVLCGDCESVLRCPRCKGPMRQVSSTRLGMETYRCMQCENRVKIKSRRTRLTR